METEAPKRKKPLAWIMAGLVLAVIGLGIWVTREPAPPFSFLSKYQVAERRSSQDGRLKILVLKAEVGQVWNDIQAEFAGKPRFNSTGLTNMNGMITEYRSLGTEEGVIKVSNDLSFANEGLESTIIGTQEVRPGYCAVAYTRPKTIFDRAMEWIKETFSKPPKPRQEVAPPTIHV